MATTASEINALITQYIIENNNGEITGEQMRTILFKLVELCDGMSGGVSDYEARKGITVTTGGTVVEFETEWPEGTDVLVIPTIITESGIKVDGWKKEQFSATKHSQFTITPIMNGILDYVAFPIIL